jgi:hypothetical protein
LVADEEDRKPDQLKLVQAKQVGQMLPDGLVRAIDWRRRSRR